MSIKLNLIIRSIVYETPVEYNIIKRLFELLVNGYRSVLLLNKRYKETVYKLNSKRVPNQFDNNI